MIESIVRSSIQNDRELRRALKLLDEKQQREVGALFVDNVLKLSNDKRVTRAIQIAHDVSASEKELAEVFKTVKKAMIESRTRCGADCDWEDQAIHFVARAATAVVAPEGQCKAKDPIWQVVQSCRMARSCALIATDDDSSNPEAESQYEILNNYLLEC